MTPTSLELVWPFGCNQCNSHSESSKRPQGRGCEPWREAADVSQLRPLESQFQHESRADYQADPQYNFICPSQMNPHNLADRCPSFTEQAPIQRQGLAGPSSRFHCVEDAECLEPPLPLMSGVNYFHPSQYPAVGTPAQLVCLPADMKMNGTIVRADVYVCVI